jgi:hypothetical protein
LIIDYRTALVLGLSTSEDVGLLLSQISRSLTGRSVSVGWLAEGERDRLAAPSAATFMGIELSLTTALSLSLSDADAVSLPLFSFLAAVGKKKRSEGNDEPFRLSTS